MKSILDLLYAIGIFIVLLFLAEVIIDFIRKIT